MTDAEAEWMRLEEGIKNNIRLHLKIARESLDAIERNLEVRLNSGSWERIYHHSLLAQDAASYIEELTEVD